MNWGDFKTKVEGHNVKDDDEIAFIEVYNVHPTLLVSKDDTADPKKQIIQIYTNKR